MKLNSLRFEISILYTVILGVLLTVFSIILYFISNSSFQQTDQQLSIKAQAIDLTISSYLNVLGKDNEVLTKAVQRTISIKNEAPIANKSKKLSEDWFKRYQALNLNKDYINFFSKDRKTVISSPNLDRNLRNLFSEYGKMAKVKFRTLNYENKNIRVITYPSKASSEGEYFIQVGTSQDPLMQQLRTWLCSIIISLPLILILTSYAGRKQAERILVPVNKITEMANKITHQDLSARITDKGFDVEMGSLINSFNDMIARLEKSFKHIEEFSHHVAHELKTPLTIIKGEADLLLRKERSKHEYQQALKIVLEESERVLRTVEDLLLLAKLDYQPEAFNFEIFDFMEFFSEVCEQSRIIAAEKAVAITMRTGDIKLPAMIKGDALHLRRLFFNIIDNAIKFTPKGQCIDIRIESKDGRIITTVKDRGPGVASENLPKIFNKFFRIEGDTVGSGLGLNIARSIAKLHNGDIFVESQLGVGTTFKIILPSSQSLFLTAT
jgi:heavy metal sensor kinase